MRAERRAGSKTSSPVADELMSSIDVAWLEMDRPDNPMVVASIMELEKVTNLARLIDTLSTRLAPYPRFRQHTDRRRGHAAWIGQATLNRAYHLQTRQLPKADSAAQLRKAIADELASGLDPLQPLWRMTFFVAARGRVTVLFMAHHAMADGISLMRLMLDLADGAAPSTSQNAPAPRREGLVAAATRHLESIDAAWSRLQAYRESVMQQPRDAIAGLAGGLFALTRVLTLRDRNPACFRRPLSGSRIVDWSEPFPIAPIRAAAHHHGVTINDFFLSTLAGSIGRYLRESGPVPPHQILRVSIPVDLRAAGDRSMGNCFGLLLFDLPVGMQDARQRLLSVAAQMTRLKGSAEARAMLLSLRAVGYLPVIAEKALVGLVAGKAAAVVSNLRGPDTSLHFAGAPLESIVFWPPQTGEVGIGISLLSYDGNLTLGLCCDTGVIADPHRVIEAFRAELGALSGV